MFRIRIRIVFNAYPDTDADPAFYLNADPDPDPRSQTTKPMRIDADPDPCQTLPSQKVGFCLEKYTLCR